MDQEEKSEAVKAMERKIKIKIMKVETVTKRGLINIMLSFIIAITLAIILMNVGRRKLSGKIEC